MQSNPFPGPVTPDGMQRLGGSCSTSEYAYLRTGLLLCSYAVADIATVGLPLKLTLNYNHTDNFTDVLGLNWQHNYMMSLSVGSTTAVFTSTGGDQYGFILSGSVWIPDGDSYYLSATLTNPGGSFAPWRITFPNGCYFGFDSAGHLVVLSDKHGNMTTLQYDSNGRLTTVTEPTTRRLTMAYNSSSLLSSVTDPNGNVTRFGYSFAAYDEAHYDVDRYDYNEVLTTVTGPEGCVTSYDWDTHNPARITGRTDALGNGLTFAYNGSNQLITAVNVIIDSDYNPFV